MKSGHSYKTIIIDRINNSINTKDTAILCVVVSLSVLRIPKDWSNYCQVFVYFWSQALFTSNKFMA